MSYSIAPLPQDYLDRVRNRNIDDLGQPVRRFVSQQGGEPCRDVLRFARPGEEVILASHSPFTVIGPYREYGPVFVLANPTGEMVTRDRLPLPDGQVDRYFGARFTLRAYDRGENIIDAALVAAPEAEGQLERFLARPDTAFVHARFPFYGCFAMRIDRA